MSEAPLFTRLLALWRKEWIALRRDPQALAALFLMPAVFILIMSFALRDAFNPGAMRLRSVVVDLERSKLSENFALQLRAPEGAAPNAAPAESEAQARALLDRGMADVAVVIDKGFAQGLRGADLGVALPVKVLADPTVAIAVQQGFRQAVTAQLGSLRAAEFSRRVQSLMGMPMPVATAGPGLVPLEQTGSRMQPSAVQQSVPAWLIFGAFFVVIPLAPVFIAERRQGTLQRLHALGLGPGLLLAGKLPPFVLVNLAQALLMLAVGVWGVPLLGGEALHLPDGAGLLRLGVLTLAVSFAAVSWAFLVASFARSTEQATIIGGVGNILMGALGGVMVPKFVMPAGMQALTAISPMSWALDAYLDVFLRGAPFAALLPRLAALCVFALLCLAASVLLLRRRDAYQH